MPTLGGLHRRFTRIEFVTGTGQASEYLAPDAR